MCALAVHSSLGRDAAAGSSTAARSLGALVFGGAALAVLVQLKRRATPKLAAPSARAAAPSSFAPRALHGSAALLAGSVLADSVVEHYRGAFENPGMFTPLLTSLMTLCAGASGASSRSGRSRAADGGVYATALAVGVAGSGFHLYNVLRRPGGLGWGNLFYAAPLGAPAALSLAGLFGLAARNVQRAPAEPRLLGRPAGRVLSLLSCIGLTGTTGEVALLHFRGAFHNPFMWLPVTVPPATSALLGAIAIAPRRPALRRFARVWLALTGLLGIGGIGFHAYGVGRQMGGWRNWSQNVLSGPPLSAPPGFTALALAGFVSLALLERSHPHLAATP